MVVLIKRGDPFTAPLTNADINPQRGAVPVSTLPAIVQTVDRRAFPAYYGINGLREALLTDSGWREVAPDLLVLLAFDVVLLPLSIAAFQKGGGGGPRDRDARQLLTVLEIQLTDQGVEQSFHRSDTLRRVGSVAVQVGRQTAELGGDREERPHRGRHRRQRQRRHDLVDT